MDFKEIPLLKSPPISKIIPKYESILHSFVLDAKSAIKYVNIDTPLFIMIYLASNTTVSPPHFSNSNKIFSKISE
jgi:hypothetical protein